MRLQDIYAQPQPLTEAMEPVDILKDVDLAGKYLTKELSKMFPKSDWEVQAGKSTGFGKSFTIDVHEKEYQNNIVQNTNYRIQLMMDLEDKFGNFNAKTDFEFKALQLSSQLSNAGVVFRKIKGKTPMDTAKKAFAWFKKNEKKIKGSATPDDAVLIKKILKKFHKTQKSKEGKNDIVPADSFMAKILNTEIGDNVVMQDISQDDLYEIARRFFVL